MSSKNRVLISKVSAPIFCCLSGLIPVSLTLHSPSLVLTPPPSIEAAAPWTERVVIDKDSEGRTLLTGQNPQSALALAKELVKLVK